MNVDPQTAPVAKSCTVIDLLSPPNPAWSADEVSEYAKRQHEKVQDLKKSAAIHVYYLGQALSLARKNVKHGGWGPYLKALHISEPTAWRAIQLYQQADSYEEVAKLGITEAYLRFGIFSRGQATPTTNKENDQDHNEQASEVIIPITSFKKTTDEGGETELRKKTGVGSSKKQKATVAHRQGTPHEVGEHETDDKKTNSVDRPSRKKCPPLPLPVLLKVKKQLDRLQDEIKRTDWTKELPKDYRRTLADIIKSARRIANEIPVTGKSVTSPLDTANAAAKKS